MKKELLKWLKTLGEMILIVIAVFAALQVYFWVQAHGEEDAVTVQPVMLTDGGGYGQE